MAEADNPCAQCRRETGSDAMTWCSPNCQDAWKRDQELKRVRENLARSREAGAA